MSDINTLIPNSSLSKSIFFIQCLYKISIATVNKAIQNYNCNYVLVFLRDSKLLISQWFDKDVMFNDYLWNQITDISQITISKTYTNNWRNNVFISKLFHIYCVCVCMRACVLVNMYTDSAFESREKRKTIFVSKYYRKKHSVFKQIFVDTQIRAFMSKEPQIQIKFITYHL